MRQGEYRYSIDVICPADSAAALFADIPRLASVHPLVIGTRELPAAPDALHSYAVTDRLALGPLRFHLTYRADLLEADDRHISTRARQSPSTTLLSRVHITDAGDGITHIDVTVTVTTLSLLFAYTLRTAKAAHLRMAHGAKRLLEADAAAM
ncbi:MAG: SRPBCC family protein [Mycobacterium sp.]